MTWQMWGASVAVFVYVVSVALLLVRRWLDELCKVGDAVVEAVNEQSRDLFDVLHDIREQGDREGGTL